MSTTSTTHWKQRDCRSYSYYGYGIPTVEVQKRTLIATNTVTKGPNLSDWKERIASGRDATTYLHGVKYSCRLWRPATSVHRFVSGAEFNWVGYPNSGNVPTYPTATYTALPQAVTEAETNFAKSYRKATRRSMTGVTLAELAETASLLANPLKSMFELTHDFAKSLKRGKRLPMKRYAHFLSDSWLTYSFGMKPLASEANDYMETIRSIDSARLVELIRCFGTGSHSVDEGTLIQDVTASGNGAFAQAERQITRTTEVTIRGAVAVRGEIPPMQQFGLSALDIVPTVWEAIPFSFLVDYFTNAGDTLDALMLRYVDFSWLNQTVRNSRTATYRSIVPPAPDSFTAARYAYGGEARLVTTTVTRDKRSNNFGGSLTFEVPGQRSLKWLNIAALMNSIGVSRR